MSAQTDKERVIAEIDVNELQQLAYEAGYSAALERAAQVAARRANGPCSEVLRLIAGEIRALKAGEKTR